MTAGEAGFRVVVAAKGREALAAARQEKPLLVILDMMLSDTEASMSSRSCESSETFP